MRLNRPRVRKISSRRAHRPDQRVYRNLRRSGRRRGVPLSAVWGIVAVILVLAGLLAWRWAAR